jgi:hypothetical protein
MSINEHRGRCAAAKVFDLLFIRSEELVDVGSGSRRLICRIPYTLEEEVHPCGPTLILACSIEPVVIQAPVLFEEQAEIKDRFAQDLLGAEHKGGEQSADSAVAI